VLLGLVAVFWVGLHRDPREIPSPLVGKPAPAFTLPVIEGGSGTLSDRNLRGSAHLVNFFASWCEGCQEEHPYLLHLAREEGADIIGIDYKDAEPDFRSWIAEHGDPYRLVAADAQGQTGINWGVYGVPETFVVDARGVIVYKQIGPITPDAWTQHIKPLLNSPAVNGSAPEAAR
jgi:cytochrome c biogenesis protein CcmG/thiol:disulfide interchange protein DsbE